MERATTTQMLSIAFIYCCGGEVNVLMHHNGLAMHRMKHSGIWGIGAVSHLYRFDNEKL